MKKILIISILITASFSKDSNVEIHLGLGNIHSQNLGTVSIGYGFETDIIDRISFNLSSGFLPYMPTIGSNLLIETNLDGKDNILITGVSFEYNQAFGIDEQTVEVMIPIAYKINFDYVDDFNTSILLGWKWGNRYNFLEETIFVEGTFKAFGSIIIGL